MNPNGQKHNEGNKQPSEYAYHWNYAEYRESLRKRDAISARNKSLIPLMIILIVLVAALGVALTLVYRKTERLQQRYNRIYSELVAAEKTEQEKTEDPAQTHRKLMEMISRSAIAVVDKDGEDNSGYGFLLDGGYVLTDTIVSPSQYPTVTDTNGETQACREFCSETESHLVVLRPSATIAGTALIPEKNPYVGEQVYLVGFSADDLSQLIVEKHTVSSISEDGETLELETRLDANRFGYICALVNEDMHLVGVITSLGTDVIRTVSDLPKMIEDAQKNSNDEETEFGMHYTVDFDTELELEFVDTDTAELYHVVPGMRITSVLRDSGAELAGIGVNDIICEINDIPLGDKNALKRIFSELNRPFIRVKIYRKGEYVYTPIFVSNLLNEKTKEQAEKKSDKHN